MKYYLIVGEASGDLHASHLMTALKEADPQAEFRFFGGDFMAAVGGQLVKHYRELAYMGFIPVLMHLKTIYANMRLCKQDIVAWQPDALILVDYPGFNLNIAKYIHSHTQIPVYYYISPKIWAWKEYRIKNIKRDVDELFSILPFEVDFFEGKHHYPIHYVGNPTLDEVTAYKAGHPCDFSSFITSNSLCDKPIIALLAGSRKQEIKDNLPQMIAAAQTFADHQLVLAGAPGIDAVYYQQYLQGTNVVLLFDQTYALLQHADVALVTSGTATLETALFRVPQVVCYYISFGKVVNFLKQLVLSVKFISLVNLIAGKEVVKELVADQMKVRLIRAELSKLLTDKAYRQEMLDGYTEVAQKLGQPGAPRKAAEIILQKLANNKLKEKCNKDKQ
ncbi:MAG: lipid-A-disaccharide synthase [Bacteroidaceae bacterium]|nr:lipid-A-disaccharide synthase [Bacteroidaceae bacterium]